MVAVDLGRVRAVIDRIAAGVGELARARPVQDLDTAAALPGPRAERRRRLAGPDLEFRAFCGRRRLPASPAPQLERAWDAWQAQRYRRGEISQRRGYTVTAPLFQRRRSPAWPSQPSRPAACRWPGTHYPRSGRPDAGDHQAGSSGP